MYSIKYTKRGDFMTITEFATSRHVEPQAVSRYLSRHEAEKRTCRRVGKTLELSDKALVLLERQYPLPAPVEVVVDQETQKELIRAQKELIDMQKTVGQLQLIAAKGEIDRRLLEMKDEHLQDLRDQLKAGRDERDALRERIRILEKALDEERSRPRSVWSRIFKG